MNCRLSLQLAGVLASLPLAGLLATFAAGCVAFNRSPSLPAWARLHAPRAGWRALLVGSISSGRFPTTPPGRFPRLERLDMFQNLKNGAKRASVGALALVASAGAFAQAATTAETAFTGAITTATTNVGTFGVALVGLSVVGVGFAVAMKYVKKIRGAA